MSDSILPGSAVDWKRGKTSHHFDGNAQNRDIQVSDGSAKPRFSMVVRDSFTEKELIEKVQEQIKTEIRSTYIEGLKTKADLYSLELVLYREQYPLWKTLQAGNRFWLQRDSIQSIAVKVFMKNRGILKMHPRKMPQDMEDSGERADDHE